MTSLSPAAAELTALVERLARLGGRSAATPADDATVTGAGDLVRRIESLIRELDGGRTGELDAAHRASVRLAELGSLLPGSETLEDLNRLISRRLPEVFAGMSGGLYMGSEGVFDLQSCWGGLDAAEAVREPDCWALRLRVSHVVPATARAMACEHVHRRTGASICVPLHEREGAETLGLLVVVEDGLWPGAREGRLDGVKRQLAVAVAEQIGTTLANLQLRRQLQFWALRDPLTGLHNRRFVDEWLERETSRRPSAGESIGVVMMDVDNFKQVNDVHGHDAGDALLRALGGLLGRMVRAGDIASRYGGEEFVLVLPDIDLDTLVQRVDTLRESVAGLRVRHRDGRLPAPTVSAGVAVHPLHGQSAAEVLRAADEALYAAKKAGRNRTCTPVGGPGA